MTGSGVHLISFAIESIYGMKETDITTYISERFTLWNEQAKHAALKATSGSSHDKTPHCNFVNNDSFQTLLAGS